MGALARIGAGDEGDVPVVAQAEDQAPPRGSGEGEMAEGAHDQAADEGEPEGEAADVVDELLGQLYDS